MANISNVDYAAIPSHTKQMRNLGQELNSELTTAYQSIGNMHNSWYGKRYNELVKLFNNLVPTINELLELVVGEIPFTLETVANNYSRADQGTKVTNAEKTEPKKITILAITNDVGMKFVTSEVEIVKTNVSGETGNFNTAIAKMNAIEREYAKVDWNSEAAQAFATKFAKLKADIVSAFENINTQFEDLMTQTLADVQATENANTVQ